MGVERIWQIEDSISPVFSDWGFKNWDLCFAKDGIVTVPRGLWISFQSGVWAGLGNFRAMRQSWSAQASPGGVRMLEDGGCMDWRRYSIEDIESINDHPSLEVVEDKPFSHLRVWNRS